MLALGAHGAAEAVQFDALALKLADRVDRQCGGVGFPRAGDACLQPLHLFDDPAGLAVELAEGFVVFAVSVVEEPGQPR